MGLGAASLLAPQTFFPTKETTHILSLSFDDGFRKSFIRTAEIYEKHGLKACFNVLASGHMDDFEEPDDYMKKDLLGDFELWNELQSRGHEIGLKIGSNNLDEFSSKNVQGHDVAIEFSTPETAFHNISTLLSSKIPTVSGTTAWLDKFDEAKAICTKNDTAFLYASNFSVGMNLFFELNKKLAELMKSQDQYEVSMEEIHHTAKLDAPSGTAVTLAEGILGSLDRKKSWVNEEASNSEQLSIISKRIDPAPGTHSITYKSSIDDIEICHTAHSREGFAMGAVLAAEYLHNKKGFFKMRDVLNI